ncbi:MAG TPA: hypothetical protein DEA73_05235 [Peptococcaceae bacterium]|nr:hypothetical protein [Peptococcaceae bacterium]
MREEHELRLLAALYTPQVVRAMADRATQGDVEAARLVLEVAGVIHPPVEEGEGSDISEAQAY